MFHRDCISHAVPPHSPRRKESPQPTMHKIMMTRRRRLFARCSAFRTLSSSINVCLFSEILCGDVSALVVCPSDFFTVKTLTLAFVFFSSDCFLSSARIFLFFAIPFSSCDQINDKGCAPRQNLHFVCVNDDYRFK